MRVMVVSNIFPPHARGGYELGMLDVARTFAKAGHEVEVVTSRAVGMLEKVSAVSDIPVREVFAPVLAYESDLGERLEHSPAWHQYRTEALGGVDAASLVALDIEIRRFRPDRIWIGNPLGIGPVGVLETALGAGVPVVVHLMDDIDRYLAGYRRPLHWNARVARLKRSLTAVSCSTLVREANSTIGTYRDHVVVPNGFDFDSIGRRARPALHDGPLRFVYAGQIEPMKGIPQLIEGVSRLAGDASAPRFTLDLIGPASASFAGVLERDLRERGLADRVRLIGRVEKAGLLDRLASYDAAVLLLKTDEAFGYAWLEAAAVGLPVIVTRGRAVSETFPADYPLFVGDRDNPEDVAAAIRWCTQHRGSLASAGASLGQHLAAKCDANTVINPRYLEMLESARPPRVGTDRDTLLASVLTCQSFGLAQDGWRIS
jgi:glycosyltransferase involved in cell wall biosynthesis